MSKSFNMSGWRVGMVLGKQKYINAVLQAKSNVDSGMFLPVQKAASEALMLPMQWHNQRNSIYAKRRKFALELISQLNCSLSPNQVGMFLWAKIPPSYKRARYLVDKLLEEAHIFIAPGEIFGSNGNRFIRVSLASPQEDFKLAIERVIKWKTQKVLA
jgi:aspartate/methionine/tyrosine aminotransferase